MNKNTNEKELAIQYKLDTTNFDNTLNSSDTDLQSVAEKVDNINVASGSPTEFINTKAIASGDSVSVNNLVTLTDEVKPTVQNNTVSSIEPPVTTIATYESSVQVNDNTLASLVLEGSSMRLVATRMDGDNLILGNDLSITAQGLSTFDILRVSDDMVCIFYSENNTVGTHIRTCSLSDMTFTHVSDASLYSGSYSPDVHRMCKLDDTNYICTYREPGAGQMIYAKRFTISAAGVISLGSTISIGTDSGHFNIVTLDSTRALLLHGTASMLNGSVINLVGTSLVKGTANNIQSVFPQQVEGFLLSPNKVVVNMLGYVKIIVLDGDSIVQTGSPITTSNTARLIKLVKINETRLLFAFAMSANDTYYIGMRVSGGIYLGTTSTYTLASENPNTMSLVRISESKVVYFTGGYSYSGIVRNIVLNPDEVFTEATVRKAVDIIDNTTPTRTINQTGVESILASCIVKIDESRILVATVNRINQAYTMLFDIDSDGNYTLLTTGAIFYSGANGIEGVLLDSGRVALVLKRTTTPYNMVVLAVNIGSDNSITYLNNITFGSSSGTHKITRLTNDKFLVGCIESSGLRLTVCTISGSTISNGTTNTEYAYSDVYASIYDIESISDTAVLLVRNTLTVPYSRVDIININGTSCSIASSTDVDTIRWRTLSIVKVLEHRFMVLYSNMSDSNRLGGVIIETNGGYVTVHSPMRLDTDTQDKNSTYISKVSPTKVICGALSLNYYPNFFIVNINDDNTFDAGNLGQWSSTLSSSQEASRLVAINSTTATFVRSPRSSPYELNLVTLSFNEDKIVSEVYGVSKESKSSLQDCQVSVGPFINGFTGLTQGKYYYLDTSTGNLTDTPTTLDKVIGLAVSDTEIQWLADNN